MAVDDSDEGAESDDSLFLVLGDLSHIVHNASNLVLGHVAAIQRDAPSVDRLDERAKVIERALSRITEVVDALRASVDPDFWGPPVPSLIDEVLIDAVASQREEAARRRVRIDRAPAPVTPARGTTWVANGATTMALVSSVIAAELEGVGSNGRLTIEWCRMDADLVCIDLVVERDDGLPLQRRDQPSVWRWIALRFADLAGATIDAEDDDRPNRIMVPIAAEPRRR